MKSVIWVQLNFNKKKMLRPFEMKLCKMCEEKSETQWTFWNNWLNWKCREVQMNLVVVIWNLIVLRGLVKYRIQQFNGSFEEWNCQWMWENAWFLGRIFRNFWKTIRLLEQLHFYRLLLCIRKLQTIRRKTDFSKTGQCLHCSKKKTQKNIPRKIISIKHNQTTKPQINNSISSIKYRISLLQRKQRHFQLILLTSSSTPSFNHQKRCICPHTQTHTHTFSKCCINKQPQLIMKVGCFYHIRYKCFHKHTENAKTSNIENENWFYK